jgi:outer membrane protein TolC
MPVLLVSASAAAEQRVLTLEEAVNRALAGAPAIRSAAGGLDAALARQNASATMFGPSLTGVAAYNRQTGNFAPRPGLSARDFGAQEVAYSSSNRSYDYFNFALSLQQTIWDHGRTLGTFQSSKAAVQAADREVASVRMETAAQVAFGYYGVLAAEEMVGVATRARDQARRHADRTGALFQAGLRPRIDQLRAEADAQNAEAALLGAVDGARVSRAVLLAAMGETGRPDFKVVDPGEPLIPEGLDESLDAAIDEALSRRPESARLKALLAVQDGVIRSVRGRWLPIVGANASVSDAGLELTNLVWNWSVGASVTVPSASAVQTTYEVREAEAQRARLKADLDSLDLAIRLEVEEAAARIAEARDRLKPVRAALAAAREALELADGMYQTGTGNYVELLDSQAALANAEAAEVRARHDLAVARIAWDRVMGRLPVPDSRGDGR